MSKGTEHEIQNFTARAVPSSCGRTITPACLQALYNIPTTKATESSNTLGVTGFIKQYANKADLKVRLLETIKIFLSRADGDGCCDSDILAEVPD